MKNIQRIRRLSQDERAYICGCTRRGDSITLIAKNLSRDKSTISRELRRNAAYYQDISEPDSYKRAIRAHKASHHRRVQASKRLRLKNEQTRKYVEARIKRFWSPELISGRAAYKKPECYVCAEAIYQWIYNERPELRDYLTWNKIRYKRGGKNRRVKKAVPKARTSIDLRPKAANEREEIGHFETDAVVSKKSTNAVQTTVDRKSRKVMYQLVPNLKSEEYADILIKRFEAEGITQVAKTNSLDNGPENAAHQAMADGLGVEVFFCHPYCASERGSVENRNLFLRRFFPKGTNFAQVEPEYLQWVQDLANDRPMKCLGYLTPNEVWDQELAEIEDTLPPQQSCSYEPASQALGG